MVEQKEKRSQGRRWSILILEGLIVIVALVLVMRFLSDDEADNQPGEGETELRATISAIDNQPDDIETELRATIAAQEALLRATAVIDPVTIRERAENAEARGDEETAIAEYTRLIELDNTDADAYYQRGRIYYDDEDWENAIADFNMAIEYDHPQTDLVYFYRGFANSEFGNYDQAISDYTRSISLDTDCENECWIDYNNRGVTYERSGDLDAALADYDTAVDLNPNYALAYSNRGYLHEDLDMPEDALADWNRAFELRQQSLDERDMPGGSLILDSEITEAGHQIYLTFEGESGQTLNAITERPDFSLDPALMLRNSEGEPLIFNDDFEDENRDAKIEDYELPENDTYTLVIAAANGRATGEFTLTVSLE